MTHRAHRQILLAPFDGIVTNDLAASRRFVAEVDAAAVYVNASTRFTDGGEFGLGPKSASRPKSCIRGADGALRFDDRKIRCDRQRANPLSAPQGPRRRNHEHRRTHPQRPQTKEISVSVGAVIFAFAVVGVVSALFWTTGLVRGCSTIPTSGSNMKTHPARRHDGPGPV
jgi:hypothetical protein